MISEPSIVERAAQPYVAIRQKVTMQDFGSVIDQTLPQVFAWLGAHGVPPAGAPIIRYLVINMADKLDVELGVPVATEPSVEGPISMGVLPPGRCLAYARGRDLRARFEAYLTDPRSEPDPSQWKTEVAIRVADSAHV